MQRMKTATSFEGICQGLLATLDACVPMTGPSTVGEARAVLSKATHWCMVWRAIRDARVVSMVASEPSYAILESRMSGDILEALHEEIHSAGMMLKKHADEDECDTQTGCYVVLLKSYFSLVLEGFDDLEPCAVFFGEGGVKCVRAC